MNTLQANQSITVAGLGTTTFTAPSTLTYVVTTESFINPPSGLIITINHNGSPVATQSISAPSAQTMGLSASIACTAADTVTIVLTSSNQNDTIPNNIRTVMSAINSNF